MHIIKSLFILFIMKVYLKYLLVIFFTVFSFYYADKVIELSEYNNTILASINDYAIVSDRECIEGYINENGIVLGLSGLVIDKNKSYSNMKGIGFKKELIKYKKNKCILNKEDNIDKYIIGANKYIKNISLVFDMDTFKYYKDIVKIEEEEKVRFNYLINKNNYIEELHNVLYKTNSNDIKEFKKKVKSFYCVKYDSFEVIDYCKKLGINSIRMINHIEKDLLINTKKILDKGIIIFIKENKSNLNELVSTIKYIKSRGYNIVSIDELLS